MTFRQHYSEGWQDGLIVTVSVNDQPHAVSVNEATGGDSGDSDGGGDGPGDPPPPQPQAAPQPQPQAAPQPQPQPAPLPQPQAAPEEALQVLGHDSVERVLQGVANQDSLLDGVLEDMGVESGEDSVFQPEEDPDIVLSSQQEPPCVYIYVNIFFFAYQDII